MKLVPYSCWLKGVKIVLFLFRKIFKLVQKLYFTQASNLEWLYEYYTYYTNQREYSNTKPATQMPDSYLAGFFFFNLQDVLQNLKEARNVSKIICKNVFIIKIMADLVYLKPQGFSCYITPGRCVYSLAISGWSEGSDNNVSYGTILINKYTITLWRTVVMINPLNK